MENEVGEHLKKDWDIVIKAINALPEKDPKITDEDVKLLNWFVETAVLDHYGPFFDEKFVSQRRTNFHSTYDGALNSCYDRIEV